MRLVLVAGLVVASVGCIGSSSTPPATGARFETRPEKLETVDNTEYFQLKTEFRFIDAQGTPWLAPAETKTDGASVPQFFLSFIGDRFDPKYRAAALVHDAYCQEINAGGASFHEHTWQEVHNMFYEACVVGGTSKTEAQLMFAAVWLRGPRWDVKKRSLKNEVSDAVQKEEFKKCRQWLEQKERTNQELVEWMTRREPQLKKGISPPLPAT